MVILTLISKCLGFVREMIMANYFGTTYITDAYVMAIALPGIIFGGIFGAVATAYMPTFSKIIEVDGEKTANKFTSEVINLLLVASVVSALIGFIFSDQIVTVLASGFEGETAKLTSIFIKVTFCYVLFTSVAGILEAYLQYKGFFLIQIVLGHVQNIIVIGVIVLSAATSHYYLAIGWLIAYITRVIILMIYAKQNGFIYRNSLNFTDSVKKIIIVAFPVFVSLSIQQINTFVDKSLASGLLEGSVAALNYAMILVTLVTGLTSTILTTIFYPKLNQANSLEDYGRFSKLIETGVTLISIIAIPCTLGAMVYSGQIVQIVYERGAFEANATMMTSSVFFFYSIQIVFLSLNEFIIRLYYSLHDMKTPMIFAGVSVIINVVLNLILVRFMACNGLALATSIACIANTGLLFISVKTKYPYIKLIESKAKLLKILTSAVVSILISYLVYNFVIIPLKDIIYMRIAQLGLAVLVAGITYLFMLWRYKIEEIKLINQIVKRN